MILLAPSTLAQDDADRTPSGDWIETTGLISLDAAGSGVLDLVAAIHEMDLPSAVVGCDPCSAGDIRFVLANSGSRRAQLVAALEGAIEDRIERYLDPLADNVTADARLDEESLTAGGEYTPPVLVSISGPLDVPAIGQLAPWIEAGAGVHLATSASVDDGNLLDLVLAVEGASFASAAGEPPQATLHVVGDALDRSSPATLALDTWIQRPDATVPPVTDATVEGTLDLRDFDLHLWKTLMALPSLSSGTPPEGLATIVVKLNAELVITGAGPELGTQLGFGAAQLSASADAVRNALQSGLVPQAALESLLDRASGLVTGALGTLAAGLEPVVQLADTDVSLNGSPLGTGPPVRLLLRLNQALDLPPPAGPVEVTGDGGTAATIAELPLPRLELPSVLDLPTTWTILLPAGLEFRNPGVTGGTYEQPEPNVLVVHTTNTASVQPSVAITTGFLLRQLIVPLLLSLLVLVVLVALVVVRVRSRRRQKRAQESPGDEPK